VNVSGSAQQLSGCGDAAALPTDHILRETMHSVAGAIARSPGEQLPTLLSPFTRSCKCAIEADVRWLRATLLAKIDTVALRRDEDGWQEVPGEIVAALVNPMAHGRKDLIPRASPATDRATLKHAELELARVRSKDLNGLEIWSHYLPAFRAALIERTQVIVEEGRDALDAARRELVRAEAAVEDALERGNRGQITRLENLRDLAFDLVEMTNAYWQKREAWLSKSEETLAKLRPKELLSAVINAVGMST
jgi:hypothetical protein